MKTLYQAYLEAYRSGEIAAMFGRESDAKLEELAKEVPAVDHSEQVSIWCCLYDGYAQGLDGGEPMSERQVECHYD